MHFQHYHIHGDSFRRDNALGTNELSLEHPPSMAPRAPYPLPSAIPRPDVGGFGTLLNYSTAAEPYSHGLDGVNQEGNFLFVNILFGSVIGILLVTALQNWLNEGRNYLRRLFTLEREADQRFWMYNHSQAWAWSKRHIFYAPLFRVRHHREIQLSKAIAIGTLPSRFDTILLTLYCIFNIAYALVLQWDRENPYSVVAELRGRTGSLAVLNMVLAVISPLRNSPIAKVFGVSYDTLNLYHRCFGRLTVFEALIHSICWGVNNYMAGGRHQLHVSLSTSTSYQWGMVGTCVFITISILAWGPIRHAAYETFLNAHRLLVFIALLGAYLHLSRAGLPQVWYAELCFAFWAAEWAWRAYRIWYYNFSRQRKTEILIEALPSEAVRATFTLARTWRWRPGCYVHIYLPALALWSSHPFSVAWAETKTKALPMEMEMEKLPASQTSVILDARDRPNLITRMSNYSRRSEAMPTVTGVAEATHKPESINITIPREANVHSISCVIRAREGMTKKLYERAMAAGDSFSTRKFTTWGAVEGPYGGHHDLASYGTVILFAGGVGITHPVSFIYHLLLQHQAGICSTRKILLVWSVPNTEALEWIRPWMDQILRMEGRRDVLKIKIFVTKPRHREEVISNTGSVQMFPGRCNPVTIMANEVPERIGAMGVTMCGPGAFADPVRAAVRPFVEDGVIDFFEEAFTY